MQTAIRELATDVRLTADMEIAAAPPGGNPAARKAGRTFSHIAAVSAAQVWQTAPDKGRQAAMLSAGGEGSGAMWTMQGINERKMVHNGHFREALRLRLGINTAPRGTTCQLIREGREMLNQQSVAKKWSQECSCTP